MQKEYIYIYIYMSKLQQTQETKNRRKYNIKWNLLMLTKIFT